MTSVALRLNEECKEDTMNRLLACTGVALALGLSPALAADQQGQLPTQPGVSSGAANAAHQPQSGSADASGGAAEQSSASPNSGAAGNNAQSMNSGQSSDQSGGAKEQSSAPPNSAASVNKPNPTIGQQNSSQPSSQTE